MAESKAAVQTAQAAKGSARKVTSSCLARSPSSGPALNKRSLSVRLETGSLLNARLGQPTLRQPRGPSVLKQAAETLHTAESELIGCGGSRTSARMRSPAGVKYL